LLQKVPTHERNERNPRPPSPATRIKYLGLSVGSIDICPYGLRPVACPRDPVNLE
jgi:hypothetical protein